MCGLYVLLQFRCQHNFFTRPSIAAAADARETLTLWMQLEDLCASASSLLFNAISIHTESENSLHRLGCIWWWLQAVMWMEAKKSARKMCIASAPSELLNIITCACLARLFFGRKSNVCAWFRRRRWMFRKNWVLAKIWYSINDRCCARH